MMTDIFKISSITFNRSINKLVFFKNRFFKKNRNSWEFERLQDVFPRIYIYNLPRKFKSTSELSLVSETFYAVYDFFRLYCQTNNPAEADYFFVPINLIQFQFKNENPIEILNYLKHFEPTNRNHILVALGDYSQHSRKNHFGLAYQELYDWMNDFILLALESTSDLTTGVDIGIIPYNTLCKKPVFNSNMRPYLYSFFGELSHPYLPLEHIRNKIKSIPLKRDVFIGSTLPSDLKRELRGNYSTSNEYELISRNSVFTLAPAGFGRWTYRFFQAIQWGSIPVLLSDDYIKPFEDSIPYDQFCITLDEKNISEIDAILRSYTENEIKTLQTSLKENQCHFTYNAFFRNLCNKLNSQNQK
jgi:hypothetical protein